MSASRWRCSACSSPSSWRTRSRPARRPPGRCRAAGRLDLGLAQFGLRVGLAHRQRFVRQPHERGTGFDPIAVTHQEGVDEAADLQPQLRFVGQRHDARRDAALRQRQHEGDAAGRLAPASTTASARARRSASCGARTTQRSPLPSGPSRPIHSATSASARPSQGQWRARPTASNTSKVVRKAQASGA